MSNEQQGYGQWQVPGQAADPREATGPGQQTGSDPYGHQVPGASAAPSGGDLARVQYQPQAHGQAQWASPAPASPAPAYPVTPVVAAKSGGVGVLLSFFIPGLGSMVNGSVAMGLVILAADFVSWLLTFVLIGIPLVFAVWIWGMIDAYLAAQRWNRAHGLIT